MEENSHHGMRRSQRRAASRVRHGESFSFHEGSDPDVADELFNQMLDDYEGSSPPEGKGRTRGSSRRTRSGTQVRAAPLATRSRDTGAATDDSAYAQSDDDPSATPAAGDDVEDDNSNNKDESIYREEDDDDVDDGSFEPWGGSGGRTKRRKLNAGTSAVSRGKARAKGSSAQRSGGRASTGSRGNARRVSAAVNSSANSQRGSLEGTLSEVNEGASAGAARSKAEGLSGGAVEENSEGSHEQQTARLTERATDCRSVQGSVVGMESPQSSERELVSGSEQSPQRSIHQSRSQRNKKSHKTEGRGLSITSRGASEGDPGSEEQQTEERVARALLERQRMAKEIFGASVSEAGLETTVDAGDESGTNIDEEEDSDGIADGEDYSEATESVSGQSKPLKNEKSSSGRPPPPLSKLQQLLEKGDQYASLLLGRSLDPHHCHGSKKDKEIVKKEETKGRKGTSARHREAPTNNEKEEEDFLMKETEEELLGHQTFTRLIKQPALVTGGIMKPYQLDGLNWLIHLYESGLNGILADEMGLGKTLQTISLLAYLKEARSIPGPHLVLAPKSTLGNWMAEIQKFAPSLNAFKFHGNKEERAAMAHTDMKPGVHDVIVTSYELCMKEQSLLRKFRFKYVVVDEAHRIKNEASKLSKVIRLFKTQFRLLLTGTPLQNNLRELWALLNFIFPEMFSSSEEFDRIFDLTGAFASDGERVLTQEEREERNSEIVLRLHKILRPFLLRRVKSEVMVDIPPKKELLLYVPLSALQRTLYRDLLSKNVDALQDVQGGGRLRLLNLAMQLRKACNHPYLFEGYEDKGLDPFGEHVVMNSGKLMMLDRLLQKLIDRGSRTLIFTQMTRMLDILEDYCRMRGFEYCRIDGSTAGEDRDRQIEEFNAPDSPLTVFLLSTRAGGLGINLATADTVVIYDSDWNPQVDLQAMDRAHRIGQKKNVNVYRMIHEHTIEEKIIERATLKLQLDSAVIQQGRLTDRQKQLSKNELMGMIQFGADHIFKAGNSLTLSDADVEAILSRGEERSKQMSAQLQSRVAKSALDFNTSFSDSSRLYQFEGTDYSDESQRSADRLAWAEMGVAALEEERNAKRKVRVVQEQYEALHRQQREQQQLLLASSGDRRGAAKLPKLPKMEDWQFYQRDRILQLHDAEVQYATLGDLTQSPTEDAREEKARLLREGFGDWQRRDFLAFVRAAEVAGVDDVMHIAKEVGKPVEEVKRYAETFMARHTELADWERWMKRVRSGDSALSKKKEMEAILAAKLKEFQYPWQQFKVRVSKPKSNYTDEEDTWILNMTHLIGFGSWERLQMLINLDPRWRFDWFLRTRSPLDLGKRVELLIKLIKREAIEEAGAGAATPTKRASKAKPSRASLAPTRPLISRSRSGRQIKRKEESGYASELDEVFGEGAYEDEQSAVAQSAALSVTGTSEKTAIDDDTSPQHKASPEITQDPSEDKLGVNSSQAVTSTEQSPPVPTKMVFNAQDQDVPQLPQSAKIEDGNDDFSSQKSPLSTSANAEGGNIVPTPLATWSQPNDSKSNNSNGSHGFADSVMELQPSSSNSSSGQNAIAEVLESVPDSRMESVLTSAKQSEECPTDTISGNATDAQAQSSSCQECSG